MKTDNKDIKVKFDDKAESLVRRTLSDLEDSTRALSLWLENSLKEWELHDPMIFGFQVRVKSVKSTVKKAKYLSEEKGIVFQKSEDVTNNINDIVGARIIVYSHDKILSLHQEITAHTRFEVTHSRIHYRAKDSKENFIEDFISEMTPSKENKSYTFEHETNKTGYTDVHYWIKPKTYDRCYEKDTANIYEKFELQTRTITQHAWSEMQHKMVYKIKNKQEKERKLKRFESLVDIVNEFDTRLNSEVNLQKLSTPSKNIDIDDTDTFIKKITSLIHSFEQEETAEVDKKEIAKNIFKIYSKKLDEIQDKSFEYKLQVCLFALKSGLYSRAGMMYRSYIFDNKDFNCDIDNYEWALLRYAEFHQALGDQEKTKKTIMELLECIERKSYDAIDNSLLCGLAVIFWWCNLFNDAVKITNILLDSKNSKEKEIQLMLNLLYYNSEIIFLNKANKGFKGQKDIFDTMHLTELSVLKKIKEFTGKMRPNLYDSLTYYFYTKSEYYLEQDRIFLSEEANNRAQEYITLCFETAELQKYDVDELWSKHKIEVRHQSRRISLMKKDD